MMVDGVCSPRVAHGALVGSMSDAGVDFLPNPHRCAHFEAA
jgi:hypothetical protein